jgi:hypothetical protein
MFYIKHINIHIRYPQIWWRKPLHWERQPHRWILHQALAAGWTETCLKIHINKTAQREREIDIYHVHICTTVTICMLKPVYIYSSIDIRIHVWSIPAVNMRNLDPLGDECQQAALPAGEGENADDPWVSTLREIESWLSYKTPHPHDSCVRLYLTLSNHVPTLSCTLVGDHHCTQVFACKNAGTLAVLRQFLEQGHQGGGTSLMGNLWKLEGWCTSEPWQDRVIPKGPQIGSFIFITLCFGLKLVSDFNCQCYWTCTIMNHDWYCPHHFGSVTTTSQGHLA